MKVTLSKSSQEIVSLTKVMAMVYDFYRKNQVRGLALEVIN